MAHEGHWLAYTAAEADALQGLEEAWSTLSARGKEVREALCKAGADERLAGRMDDAAGAVVDAERRVIHARLCRVLPHLPDVIAIACWPEFGSTPQWLPETGLPHPVTHPSAAYIRREKAIAPIEESA